VVNNARRLLEKDHVAYFRNATPKGDHSHANSAADTPDANPGITTTIYICC
jgi:hypothetical protein